MRYSERAKTAIRFANQEAARLSHDHISTGHLLLGLIREGEGVAIEILKDAKVDLDKMQFELESMIEDKGRGVVIGKLQLSSRANAVLKLAEEESQSMQHKYIGTEHLLLALIREGEGVASKVLNKFGVQLDRAREIALTFTVDEEEHSETLTFHNAQFTLSSHNSVEHTTSTYEKDVLNLEEASELLRVTVNDLKELLKAEEIPGRMIGSQWRFSRSALIRWLGEGNSQDYHT